MMKLIVATCQFPVSADIRRNQIWITNQMIAARRRGAHLAHFSEASLSGYAGIEFPSFDDFDWEQQRESMVRIMSLAKKLKLWVVVGAAHALSGGNRPHNCLYVVDDHGRLQDRYDKMFCTGSAKLTEDLAHYSPGDHFVVFTAHGVRCGVQICHDCRYQELYRELKKRGCQAVLHSYHNGHSTRTKLQRAGNIWASIIPATMQTYAANNHLWISANNTSARECSWPSFVVRPDGFIVSKLRRHQAGMLITSIDPRVTFFDASANWRNRAMNGIYHSGKTIPADPRSKERRSI